MEVPTDVSFFSQFVEQIIDIPVTGCGSSGYRDQGFHPGQASLQRTVQQIVDIPVSGGAHDFLPGQSSATSFRDRGRGGGLQASLPAQGSMAFGVPGGGLRGFVPGQSSTAFRGEEHHQNRLVEFFKAFSND